MKPSRYSGIPADAAGNIPNLDCEESEYLERFAAHHAAGENAGDLFPEATGAWAREVTADLARYAMTCLDARRFRAAGDIAAAMHEEGHCHGIYTRLPNCARW